MKNIKSLEFLEKFNLKVFYGIIFIFLCILFSLNIHILTFDEVEWKVQTQIVLNQGAPNQIWHPPLYLYLLSGFIKIFGTSMIAWRAFGFVFFLINLSILCLLVNRIFEKHKYQKSISILITTIYSFSPMLFQQSLLLDIDNTLLVTWTLLGMLTLYKAFENDDIKKSWKYYTLFSIITGLYISSKLITPLIFLMAVFFYLIISKYWKKTIYFIIFSIIGILIFLILWLIYSNSTGIEFTSLFESLYSRLATEFNIKTGIKILQIATLGALWEIMWFTPAFIIILLFITYKKIKYWTNHKTEFQDIALIFFLLMMFFYHIVRPSGIHLKYTYPAFVVILIPICEWIYDFKVTSNSELWIRKVLNAKKNRKYLLIKSALFIASGVIIYFLNINYTHISNTYLISDHIESYKFIEGISTIPITLILIGLVVLIFAIISYLRNYRKTNKILNKLEIYLNNSNTKILVAIFLLNLIYILILGDYLIGVIYLNPLIILLACIPTIIVLILTSIGMKKMFNALIIIIISTGLAILIIQSTTTYNKQTSWTNYGEEGIEYLISKYSPECSNGKVFLTRYDIGNLICNSNPYTHEKITTKIIYFDKNNGEYNYNSSLDNNSLEPLEWYPNQIFYSSKNTAKNTYNQISSKIDYVIVDPYSSPEMMREIIQDDFKLYEKIYDFEIYVKK